MLDETVPFAIIRECTGETSRFWGGISRFAC
jgi:hypothetical protein